MIIDNEQLIIEKVKSVAYVSESNFCSLLIVNFQLLIENRLPKLRNFVKFAIIIDLYFSQSLKYQYYLTENLRNLTFTIKIDATF